MGGIDSYRGYEYQIDISVWCTLHLMFEREICDFIQIEPASLEDIEANLSVDPMSAETVAAASIGKIKLIIQIKSRSSGPWNVSDIVNIVTRKGRNTGRKAPRELVEEKNAVFVLITDADVPRELKSSWVKQIGSFSKATNFQGIPDLGDKTPRVTLFPRFVCDYANKKSEEILQHYANVPNVLAEKCRHKIAEVVRQRLLGTIDSGLTRIECEDIIRNFSGLREKSVTLSYHVMPFDHHKARAILENQHALLIYGEPGVGKSLFAEALVYEYSKTATPYKVVTERDMPRGVLEAFKTGGPVIAFLDDPWGSIKPGQEAAEWRTGIVHLLKETRSDRKIIIVSRHSVMQDVYPNGIPSQLLNIAYKLDSTAYREKERREMVERRLKTISSCTLIHEQYVWDHWGEISQQLAYPVEIIAAIDAICENIPKDAEDLERILIRCKRENLIQAYADELSQRPHHERMAALLAWALTHTSQNRWTEDAEMFRNWVTLSHLHPNEGFPIKHMINLLKKIGWLDEDAYRGLHIRDPRIEEAFGAFFERYPDNVQIFITFIFEKLSDVGRSEDALRMIEGLTTRELRPSVAILKTLDNWLLQNALSCPSENFLNAWRALGNWHVSDDPWAIFARAFNQSQVDIESDKKKKKHSVIDFRAPYFDEWSQIQTEEIKQCDTCKLLAERLVSEYFVGCSEYVEPVKIIQKFHELEWQFSNACLNAAVQILTDIRPGSPRLLEAYALGLRFWGNDNQLEQMLTLLLDEHTKVSDQYDEWEKKEGNILGEGILHAAYEAWVYDTPDEMFSPIYDAMNPLVLGLAQRKGLEWLEQAIYRDPLFDSCCRALGHMKEFSGEDAVENTARLFFSIAKEPWQKREIWRAVGKAGLSRMIPELIEALRADDADEVKGALEGLANLYDAEQFGQVVSKRSGQLSFVEKCRLSQELKKFEGPIEFFSPEEYRKMTCIEFNSLEQVLLNSLPRNEDIFSTLKKNWAYLNGTCRDDAIELAKAEDISDSFRALTLASCGGDIRAIPLAKSWDSCKDNNHRFLKIQALIQFPDEYAEALLIAIKDKHYKCRRLAVQGLANTANQNELLRQIIIDLATKDPSGPVREACIRAIGQYQWADGIPALLDTLKDTRDIDEDTGSGSLANHHIARVAAQQLDDFLVYDGSLVEPLLRFINAGNKIQQDVVVHYYVILALRHRNDDMGVAKVLSELLMDDWFVHALRKSGYVRRMAAILALVGTRDESILQNAIDKITDSDDRIAGPTMIVISNFREKGIAYISRILEMDEKRVPKERKLLALAILMLMNGEFPQERLSAFSSDMVIARWLLMLCSQPESIGKVPIQQWMLLYPFLGDLNNALQELGGLGPSYYLLLKKLLGSDIEDICCFDQLVSDTMPENMSVISIRHFLGCE